MPTIVLHIQNEEAIVGEVDKLPGTGDTLIFLKNARRRDGNEVPYIDRDASMVIFAFTRIHFIEIMGDGEEEKIISHVRE
jgi:hypothetical protein